MQSRGDGGFLPEPSPSRSPLPGSLPEPRRACMSRWRCGRDGRAGCSQRGWGRGREDECAAGWTLQRCGKRRRRWWGGGGTRLYLVAEGWKGCRAASPRCARSQPPGVRGACAPAPRLLSLAGRQRATGCPRHRGADTRQAGSGHRVAAKNCGSACAPGRARRPAARAAPRPRSAPAGAPGLRKRRGPERGRGRDTGGELGQGARGCPRLSRRGQGRQPAVISSCCSAPSAPSGPSPGPP